MSAFGGKFIALSGKPEASTDSRFGPVPQAPALWSRLCDENCDRSLAFIVAHPSGNFLNHYLLGQLERRGAAALGINTRYVGNDTFLLMERAIQDLGAGVQFLRREGFKRIVLIGNSGGGSLAAFYQSQAENLTIKTLPDGTPFEIHADDLPPADAIALLAAHPSRASVLTDYLDPSVLDESNVSIGDPSLDMFNPENGPPYDREWLRRYRSAQLDRNERLTSIALSTLKNLDTGSTSGLPITDLPLVIHRTGADPRFLDMSIDPDDRSAQNPESVRVSNYAANNMARMSSLRSWLSQWSVRCSRADGPACLSRTSVPVLAVRYSADGIAYTSHYDRWLSAAKSPPTTYLLKGARHFLRGQPEQQNQLADTLVDWARTLN